LLSRHSQQLQSVEVPSTEQVVIVNLQSFIASFNYK